ncbi:hypothetical protein AX774_g7690 [Zancudomyces culisetae]|uniref:Uncharacterized protein n=1 Tax=Zancudomyces culisetae TaxID=1213189 RepID=A0A1R1PDG8_ZANCU|nr:hypothetical protein AX774_g7690 [Zancudomyces culisetae]|eukprot:OMH78912.1 hypothetical protein AX774_g7690 [Zancudomyces culisetae]
MKDFCSVCGCAVHNTLSTYTLGKDRETRVCFAAITTEIQFRPIAKKNLPVLQANPVRISLYRINLSVTFQIYTPNYVFICNHQLHLMFNLY